MKRILTIFLFFLIIGITSISYAGMADWTDEDADKAVNEQLKQQEAVIEQGKGKSDNNYLSNLEVKGYKITPDFNKDTYYYSIEEEIDENKIDIKATVEDSKATISGAGEIELQSGKNEIKITVKAENGFIKSYFIIANKKVAQKKLEKLQLNAIEKNNNKYEINLNPVFDRDVYSYSCEVYNDVEKIDVDIEKENSSDKVEINGNENLKVGRNTVTIKIKNDGESIDTTYKIEVLRKESVKTVDDKNEDKPIWENKNILIAGACAGGILLVTSIIMITKSKRKTKH